MSAAMVVIVVLFSSGCSPEKGAGLPGDRAAAMMALTEEVFLSSTVDPSRLLSGRDGRDGVDVKPLVRIVVGDVVAGRGEYPRLYPSGPDGTSGPVLSYFPDSREDGDRAAMMLSVSGRNVVRGKGGEVHLVLASGDPSSSGIFSAHRVTDGEKATELLYVSNLLSSSVGVMEGAFTGMKSGESKPVSPVVGFLGRTLPVTSGMSARLVLDGDAVFVEVFSVFQTAEAAEFLAETVINPRLGPGFALSVDGSVVAIRLGRTSGHFDVAEGYVPGGKIVVPDTVRGLNDPSMTARLRETFGKPVKGRSVSAMGGGD